MIERLKFEDLFSFEKKSKIKAGNGLSIGLYPFFTSSPNLSKYYNEAQFDGESLIFGTGGIPSIHFCDKKFAVSTDCLVAQPKKDFLVKFVYYFISSNNWILENGFKGAGLRHISKAYISNIKIPLPPLAEQKRIVQALDKAHALRQKRKKTISLLDNYLKSVFLEMFGDPIMNSKDWDKDKFGKIGTLDRGISKHRPRNAPELLGGPHPLIQTGDIANSGIYIKNYKSTYSDIGLRQSKKWKSGTICITIAANIAKTGILTFDACFPDSVVGFIPSAQRTNNEFIHFWMSFFQKILEANAPESAQKNINLRILRNLDVIVPPVELQNNFADIVHKVEQLRKTMNSQSEGLEINLGALLQEVFGNKYV
jgi:type I restriction enzyme, S subunit